MVKSLNNGHPFCDQYLKVATSLKQQVCVVITWPLFGTGSCSGVGTIEGFHCTWSSPFRVTNQTDLHLSIGHHDFMLLSLFVCKKCI